MLWIGLVSAFGVALLGACLGTSFSSRGRRYLGRLVAIATGALLAISVFDLLPEAAATLSLANVLLVAATGFLLLAVVNRYVFEICPSCGIAHAGAELLTRDGKTFGLLAVALGAHCVFDGMAMAAAARMSGGAELGVSAGMLVHKLPEGFALAILLLNAGYNPGESLLRSGAIQAMTVVGGWIGSTALGPATPPWFTGVTLAFVGGGLLFLVFHAVQGVLKESNRTAVLVAQIASFAAFGLLLVPLRGCS